MNLLEETLGVLRRYGKSKDDILWVGCHDFRIAWDNFEELAKYANYDDESVCQQVADDLIIVGIDFWLERRSFNNYHNNCEYWSFLTMPDLPSKTIKVNALIVDQAKKNNIDVVGDDSLVALNDIDLSEHDEDEAYYKMMIQRQMMDNYNNQIGIGINNNK